MAKRQRAQLAEKPSSYLTSAKAGLQFVSSGCTVLDCALGGGYPLGRMVNIVGDKSTAKTALATEALTNFLLLYKGAAAYREAEAAFDKSYAAAMGVPIDKVDFGDEENPIITVEDFYRDFNRFIDAQIKSKAPGIYVLDSLDALSDDNEMENDIGKASYGTAKAKTLSIAFRKMTRKIEQSQVLLLIVSQVRDNINARFGEKQKRSGGHAMDFYASQIMWLSHSKTLKRTLKKVERPYGVTIKAKIKKNKVGLPFRECEFDFIFGYGSEDLSASVEWLKEVGRLADADISQAEVKGYLAEIENLTDAEYRKEQKMISAVVRNVWADVEQTFLPKRAKYG